ncbi:hypothetical protein HMPREF9422_1671 [Streptococcus cristatus ATCC 51100]|nr:hypothetical protein HMPREF9422_1671 [Streptococcus cristatus ATCC 51100]
MNQTSSRVTLEVILMDSAAAAGVWPQLVRAKKAALKSDG